MPDDDDKLLTSYIESLNQSTSTIPKPDKRVKRASWGTNNFSNEGTTWPVKKE